MPSLSLSLDLVRTSLNLLFQILVLDLYLSANLAHASLSFKDHPPPPVRTKYTLALIESVSQWLVLFGYREALCIKKKNVDTKKRIGINLKYHLYLRALIPPSLVRTPLESKQLNIYCVGGICHMVHVH